MHIVLFQPEIPQNAGNIGRTCVALNAKLWFVRPTAFRLDDTSLKRAGLDYWQHLDWEAVDDWNALETQLDPTRMWFFTKFAKRSFHTVNYRSDDVLVFGSESSGLPPSFHDRFASQMLSIPMPGKVRSLNLAVSVGIAAYACYLGSHPEPVAPS